MNDAEARQAVRQCIASIRPELDWSGVTDSTPLLRERIITSFQVLDMILHLEHISGRKIDRKQLVPGSFLDISTVARVFLLGKSP